MVLNNKNQSPKMDERMLYISSLEGTLWQLLNDSGKVGIVAIIKEMISLVKAELKSLYDLNEDDKILSGLIIKTDKYTKVENYLKDLESLLEKHIHELDDIKNMSDSRIREILVNDEGSSKVALKLNNIYEILTGKTLEIINHYELESNAKVTEEEEFVIPEEDEEDDYEEDDEEEPIRKKITSKKSMKKSSKKGSLKDEIEDLMDDMDTMSDGEFGSDEEERFVMDKKQEVIFDTRTGIEWVADWSKKLSWDEAMNYVKSVGNGWRLPTRKEFKSLSDINKYLSQDELEQIGFHNVQPKYWTSEKINANISWGVDLENDIDNFYDISSKFGIVLVRIKN